MAGHVKGRDIGGRGGWPQLAATASVLRAVSVATGATDVCDVERTVTNEGTIRTALDVAKRVKIVKPDTCGITLAKGQDPAAAPDGQAARKASIEVDWTEPWERKTVRWPVQGAGMVKVSVGSTRGGFDTRELPPGSAGQ